MSMLERVSDYSRQTDNVKTKYIKTLKREKFRKIYRITEGIEFSFSLDDYENCFAFFFDKGDGLLFELSDRDYTMMLACALIIMLASKNVQLLNMKEEAGRRFFSLLGACMEIAA